MTIPLAIGLAAHVLVLVLSLAFLAILASTWIAHRRREARRRNRVQLRLVRTLERAK